MKCPNCGEKENTIKHGIRKTAKGSVQKYYCKNCENYFSSSKRDYTQYPEHVILYTLEQYNLGHPVKEAKTLTGKKYSHSPPTRTIYSWIERYEETLSFLRLRKRFDVHPDNVISTTLLDHLQVYPFKYHDLKMHLSAKKLPQLRRYISWTERSLPDKIFLKGPRASSTKIEKEKDITPKEKDNIAPELAKLALTARTDEESPHEAVERFFIRNDSKTVCSELPVFIDPKETNLIDIETPLTGHIDLIQERFGTIYIMDYKTNLNRPENHVSQLLLYKEALHQRTSIPKDKIIPAVFNEHGYYEFG